MVEAQRMTAADVVAQVRDGRLEDFVREAVVLVARELMEAEISAEVGAELREIAPESRMTHRNGPEKRAPTGRDPQPDEIPKGAPAPIAPLRRRLGSLGATAAPGARRPEAK
jgi:transposase-like protein